jgi:hypothetical protein
MQILIVSKQVAQPSKIYTLQLFNYVCRSATSVQQQRRGILAALALATVSLPKAANAGFGWDGTSSAQGSCALGDEGDECRRQSLL